MTSAFGQRVGEETAGLEAHAGGEAVGFDIFLEDGRDLGQVEADAGKVRILERDLDDKIALGGAAVGDGLVFSPGKL